MSSFLESCFQEHYPFYSKLTADEQQTLVLSSVLTTYQRGDFLYSCDDDCLGVLLVLSGKLRIFIQSGEQREITLFTTGPGEVCTLSASCAMQEISFDILIEAEEETKVLITPASTFRRLMNQNIYVENYIYRETTEHFSEVMWAMGQLLFTRLDQRLAGYLEDERIRHRFPGALHHARADRAEPRQCQRGRFPHLKVVPRKTASSHSPAARSRFSMSKSSAASAGCADSSSTRANIFPQALPCRSRKYFSKAF